MTESELIVQNILQEMRRGILVFAVLTQLDGTEVRLFLDRRHFQHRGWRLNKTHCILCCGGLKNKVYWNHSGNLKKIVHGDITKSAGWGWQCERS